MNDDQLRAALQAEYLHLQNVIEGFDGRILTIKAWSITFSLVAIGSAFASHAPEVLLVAGLSALLFWFLEASWKSFQVAYYERADAIEAFFRGETLVIQPFQVGNAWYAAWKSGRSMRLLRLLAWPHVAVPHVVVALIAFTLFALHRAGVVAV